MNGKKNIFIDISNSFLERVLSLRFDICTCSRCRGAMLKQLIAQFPPCYVDRDNPHYVEIEREYMSKHFAKLFEEVNNVIDDVSRNLPHPVEEDKEQAFDNLLRKIREDRGIDFTQYRRNILKRRIAPRLFVHHVKSYTEYLEVLARDPQEYEKMYDVLTINVTSFFRDPPVWRGIRVILREVIQECNYKKEPVRIWSAGCSSGEEPYSLAIFVRELSNIGVPLTIYATDIDRGSLEIARRGVYDSSQFMKAMNNLAKEHFIFNFRNYFDSGDGFFRAKDTLKELIDFRHLNLTSQDTINDVHIILCRNVFIYFTKPLQERIVDKFYRVLKQGGYFIIGNTETLVSEARAIFNEVDSLNRIYKKIG